MVSTAHGGLSGSGAPSGVDGAGNAGMMLQGRSSRRDRNQELPDQFHREWSWAGRARRTGCLGGRRRDAETGRPPIPRIRCESLWVRAPRAARGWRSQPLPLAERADPRTPSRRHGALASALAAGRGRAFGPAAPPTRRRRLILCVSAPPCQGRPVLRACTPVVSGAAAVPHGPERVPPRLRASLLSATSAA